VPSEQDQRDAATYQFVAALGAAMASANYPVTMVRDAMAATSRAYGLDVQLLALPNYVQVGSPTGDNLYIANPDFDVPWSLVGAATLGLLVGALSVLSRRSEAIGYMLPTICAFLVAFIPFTFNARWHVGVDSLRALAAPLATFLPGNAVLGSYASGFGGGLTLIIFALAISHRPNTPPTVSLVLPGFWLLVPGSLGFMGVTQLLGTHTAVFTATLISMMSIAVGVQTGLLLWRAAIQLTSSPDRRAMHD
jgi:uncharacterized membrane protein YjjB (DUF3815 family)